jgi:uncharacterized protein
VTETGYVLSRTPKTPKLTLGSRAFWLQQMRQWHWISAAVCLIGMLLFSFTGITLNHASQIEAKAHVTVRTARLPDALLAQVKTESGAAKRPVPAALREWVATQLAVQVGDREAEWSDEVYVSLPRPGGDAWLSIDLAGGEARYERTDRGWIAYLNDLHKGRHTGAAWSWFLDLFAVACVVFCLTGLVLLWLMAGQRRSTWPLVVAGLVIPLLLAILFIH